MKKLILFMFGICTLACSTDGSQETDKQNNGSKPTNVQPNTSAPNCETPWNSFNAGDPNGPNYTEVEYIFKNYTGDWGSERWLKLRVTPYVGAAYFDGTNEGIYEPSLPFFTNFTTSPFPNLYAGGNEIGNFIPAPPLLIDGSGAAGGTVTFSILANAEHCPVFGAMTDSSYNPLGIGFNLPSGGAPILPQEIQLLANYGKVFFYFCEAIDPVTNVVIWSNYLMMNCPNNNSNWLPTGVVANTPTVTGIPLFYNKPSKEVILTAGTFPDTDTFSHTVGTTTYNYTISLGTTPTGILNPTATSSILTLN